MIGIVVVSHSYALATAAVALAAEMVEAGDRPPMEVAAGLDEDTFGTDAAAVAEAIGRVDSPDGVLVLLDLGSAVLSAEMALEFLEPEVAERVRLSSAPLVEGLVAAAVTAGAGGDLDTVAAEAARGLTAKAGHLGDGPEEGATAPESGGGPQRAAPDAADSITREFVLTAAHGLHARPAARFVQCVNAFPQARVRVRNADSGRGPVDGRSLTAIATLDARAGHRLVVTASGDQAEDVLAALGELAATAFGDDPTAGSDGGSGPAQRPRRAPDSARQPAVYPGVEAAMGPAHHEDRQVDLTGYRPGEPAAERERLRQAVEQSRRQLAELVDRTTAQVGAGEAAIFEAHLGLLEDPGLQDPVRSAIDAGSPAPRAWQDRVAALRAEFAGLTDEYQRERAQDVTSVGERVLRALAGQERAERPTQAQEPVVLVVDELDPATAATLDPRSVVGVVTVRGGATGHGVLVARARGVPVLTGAGAAADVPEGTTIAFDARTGRLSVDPDEPTRADFSSLLQSRAAQRRRLQERAHEPASTTDGHVVLVKANLAGTAEAAEALAAGAEGSGLVRTEVLFGDRRQAPDVGEQVSVIEEIAEAMQGRPITVRTWDVGGDKPLPFHPQPEEANPFLGLRGIRSFREDPALLVDQLEAICRAAQRHPVRVMFPMVTTVEEVDWALARLDEAAHRLPDGRPDGLQVGIMVEVPAAALRPEALSTMLDFVSIGSNDLTQYTLAAERGNPGLDTIADPADPAVLQLVRATCDGVADGVEVCVCGDAASDPALALVLVGLGVTELSATTASVPAVKDAVRQHSLTDLQDLAEQALHCDSATAVRELLARFGPAR